MRYAYIDGELLSEDDIEWITPEELVKELANARKAIEGLQNTVRDQKARNDFLATRDATTQALKEILRKIPEERLRASDGYMVKLAVLQFLNEGKDGPATNLHGVNAFRRYNFI